MPKKWKVTVSHAQDGYIDGHGTKEEVINANSLPEFLESLSYVLTDLHFEVQEQGDTAEQGDTTTPLQQLVETGYFLGSGDRQSKDGLIAPEDLYTKEDLEAGIGDGLLSFLLSELVFENEGTDYTLDDRIAQAIYRLSTINAQLKGVYEALLYSDRWLKRR